jgi:hypothetical protein
MAGYEPLSRSPGRLGRFESLNYLEFLVDIGQIRYRVKDGELWVNTNDLDWIRETCYDLNEYLYLDRWKKWKRNETET